MTVLAGRGTDTPFERDGRPVSIGPEARRSHRVPRTFRVIATMNTWDKTSLFRLSYAVQRRFAIVHLGVPEADAYGALLERAALEEKGLLPPLSLAAIRPIQRLFSLEGLLAVRSVGPAVPLDMIRYMRHRPEGGDALAEAIALFLLPQLEGLDRDPAGRVYKLLSSILTGWSSDEARLEVQARYQELFPHLDLRAS